MKIFRTMKSIMFLSLFFYFSLPTTAQNCDNLEIDVRGSKCGYRNGYKGEWVIKPQFFDCDKFIEGVARVNWKDKDGRDFYGYINCKGEYLVPAQYKFAEEVPVEGFSIIAFSYNGFDRSFQGKGGVVHVKTNKTIVPLEFDKVNRVGKTFMGDKWGKGKKVYDYSGKELGTDVKYYKDGYHVIQSRHESDLKFDVYDANLNHLFSVIGWSFGPQENSDKINLFNSEGQTPFKYKGDKIGIVDKNGKIVVDPRTLAGDYEVIGIDQEGRYMVRKDGKYGFLNEVGKLIIPIQYDTAQHFSHGLAVVSKNGMYGYIDRDGKTAIPFKYTGAGSFYDGEARVEIGRNVYNINVKGEVVYDFQNQPIKKEKQCVLSCAFCGGLGYTIRQSEDCCSACKGKGYTSSTWMSNSRGGEWVNNTCWKCNGTGGCKSSSSKEYCKYCNHTGCAEYK